MKKLLLVAATLFLLTASVGQAAQVLHYNFNNGNVDGTVVDVSYFHNNGTYVGNPFFTGGEGGGGNYAVSFNNPVGDQAATQFVMLPDLTSVLGTRSFSIAVKYKSSDASGNNGRLWGNTWAGSGLVMNINTATRPAPNGLVTTDGANYALFGSFAADGTPNTADGQWHRLVVTVDRNASVSTVYVDNNVMSSSPFGFTMSGSVSFANFALGALGVTTGGENHFGAIAAVDDFQVFNSALTPAQVAAITDAPEPATWVLLVMAAAAIRLWPCRRRGA